MIGVVTAGVATYVKRSTLPFALLPPTEVTVTCTVPAVPAGDSAVIDVAELTVKLFATAEPNLTAVAPVKLVPVIVTLVAPVAGPSCGSTFVTVGTAT